MREPPEYFEDTYPVYDFIEQPEIDADIVVNWKLKTQKQLEKCKMKPYDITKIIKEDIRDFISNKSTNHSSISTNDIEIWLQLWFDYKFQKFKREYGVKLIQTYLDLDRYQFFK